MGFYVIDYNNTYNCTRKTVFRLETPWAATVSNETSIHKVTESLEAARLAFDNSVNFQSNDL